MSPRISFPAAWTRRTLSAGGLALVVPLGAALLPATASAQPTLNGAAVFGADATGSDRPSTSSTVEDLWNTVSGPSGGYYAKAFFRTTPDAQFAAGSYLNPSVDLSYQLAVGTNTFAFYANRYNAGYTPNFGLNLFFGTGAPSVSSPAISAFVAPGTGQTAVADGAACTVALDAAATCAL